VLYSYLKTTSYNESNAPTWGLSVQGNEYVTGRSDIGLSVKLPMKAPGGAKVTPEASAGWSYDFRNSQSTSLSSFQTGSTGVLGSAAPEPARNAFNLGLGLQVETVDGVNVSTKYEYEARDKFSGHNGLVEIRVQF
jgi:outer membrane autotransporter protein